MSLRVHHAHNRCAAYEPKTDLALLGGVRVVRTRNDRTLPNCRGLFETDSVFREIGCILCGVPLKLVHKDAPSLGALPQGRYQALDDFAEVILV